MYVLNPLNGKIPFPGRVHWELCHTVPRDSRMRVPGYGRAVVKVNASYAHKRTLCPKSVPTPEGNVSWA